MNDYECKQAAKKARYIEIAEKLEAEAQRLYEYDRQQMELIPLGQPILVGHHSEGRHRAALKYSHKRLHKICELRNKAKRYRHKASVINHAISSDDDDALIKLKNKLSKLEANQEVMKKINAEYRKGGFDAITGITEEDKAYLKAKMQRFDWQKKPYPSYSLSNNNAEIRRIKQRIAELEARNQEAPREAMQGNGYKVTENQEDNRIWFEFDEKPIPAICQIMKQHGFKWSPSRRAWVRMLNQAGRTHARWAIDAINKLL
jgi:hypothetical protein